MNAQQVQKAGCSLMLSGCGLIILAPILLFIIALIAGSVK